jgi:adenylate kinase family enzyme
MQYEAGPSTRGYLFLTLPPIESFGPRIMICGTSNTGKSTLAVAVSAKLGLPVVHLDQLRFLPGTDWVERPDEDMRALHDDAILRERWIMEGNYSFLLPQRLRRATGIILLGANRFGNLWRYLSRTLLESDRRLGNLEGNRDSFKWEMVRWVLWDGPRRVSGYRTTLPATGLPFVEVRSMGALRRAYRAWGLERP